MIYFIQCNGKDGPIKIGYTKNRDRVKTRLKVLRTYNPYPMRILSLIEGSIRREIAIQEIFAKDCIRGEWFKCTPQLIAFIKSGEGERLELEPKKTRKITERKWQMARLFLEGFNDSQIARKLGISRQAVHRCLGKKGFRNALLRWHG